jgi:hypothetical protein
MYSARATVYGEMKDESHMTADFQEMQRLQRKQR